MNITQTLYDTRLKMISSDNNLHPFFFFQSIDVIRARKTVYPLFQPFCLKKKPQIPYKMNYVIESNKVFTTKMDDIMNKKPRAKINKAFLELEERIKNNKKKNRENKERALTLENMKYTNRVMTQKARVLNAKYLKKLYAENHDKYLELLSRPMRLKNSKKMSKTINYRTRLPHISSTATEGFYSKTRFKTDNNLLCSTNEQSKENSLELTEQRRDEMIHNRPGHIYS
jgi:hypothetical protein